MRCPLIWPSLAILASPVAFAQSVADPQTNFGAVVAPVTLPAGAASVYGYLGAPEVGAGYRQGFGGLVELEGRVRFDYLDVSFAAEGVFKLDALRGSQFDLAPFFGIGLVGNTGSRYFDSNNFSYFGLRILPGAVASWRLTDTLRALGEIDVPIDLTLSPSGGSRVGELLGPGAEVYIGNGMSVMAMAEIGLDELTAPQTTPTTTVTRFKYLVRVGLGWRLF